MPPSERYSSLMEPDLLRIHAKFPAVAEYLSSIYILLRDYGHVTNTRLAEWNGVSVPAVTQAIGRLKRLGLVHQKRYESVTLSEEGRLLAIKVLRRHYLVEHLLVGLLGYPWDKADEEAMRLQSQISDELAEHLFRRLGSPQACPHGNPMPNAPIERALLDAKKLSEAPPGEVRIVRITEEGEQLPSMLAFCHSIGLRPGAMFMVKRGDTENLYVRHAGKGAAGTPEGEGFAETAIPLSMARHIRYEEAAASL